MFELLTVEEMYEADKLAIAGGVTGLALMEHAGRRIGDAIIARWPQAERVLILCGPGNNGGDGFVVARILAGHGYNVSLGLSCAGEKLSGDAAQMARQWDGPTLRFDQCDVSQADLIIDAIFGAGLVRRIEGPIAAKIAEINASGVPVVAVDLPSGIQGSTGQVLGAAVQAAITITFFRKKTGHVLIPGRDYCGDVSVVDIGIPDSVLAQIKPDSSENDITLWHDQFPQPACNDHKYRRGHTIVMSGDKYATGAARLGARAALRVGCGVVTIACSEDAADIIAAHETSIMMRLVGGSEDLAALLSDARISAVLLGPGNGVTPKTRSLVLAALDCDTDIVLDADALSSFQDAPETLFEKIKSRRENSVVLTPHEGEFSRLFNGIIDESKENDSSSTLPRLQRARVAARCSGAVIVLKGPDTIIAAPDGHTRINTNAPPWLATAGSGDVLAGLVAGLLGQGMSAFEAAAAAVWLHGEVGTLKGRGLIAEDLPDQIPLVLQNMQN